MMRPESPRTSSIRLALPLGLLVLAAIVSTAITLSHPSHAEANPSVALGLAAAFLVTRLLTVRLPQGDEVHATLMVGLVGLALLSVPMLIAACLGAGILDTVARANHSSRTQSIHRLIDSLRASALLGLMSPWQLALHPLMSRTSSGDTLIGLALLAAVSYALLDIVTTALQQSLDSGVPLVRSVASLVRPLGTVYVVHIPMAAAVLRLQSVPQRWAFPVALLLTLILQNSFNLYLRIRRAYSETIGALAHAAELDRPHDSGHARRVADLSIAVGRRLGLSSRELERVGYAALLHDIGRMGAAGDDTSELHARRGADLAASIPFLSDVAPLLWWEPSEDSTEPPTGWSIVRACSRYDRLRAEMGAADALLRLREDEGVQDAAICDALDSLLESPYSAEAS